jgi:hypothetical protein
MGDPNDSTGTIDDDRASFSQHFEFCGDKVEGRSFILPESGEPFWRLAS